MLFLSFLIVASASTPADLSRNYCNVYSCKPPTVSFNNITCVYPNLLYSTYLLWPCPTSLPYCATNLTSLANITCQASAPAVVYSSYPGEPCNTTSNCVFGTCNTGVCFGANLGEACTSHGQCNPGYHCSNNVCAALIAAGGTGCKTDYDCVSTSGCNINATAGLCTPYFTVKPEARISTCNKLSEGGYSYLCNTGFCLSSSSRSAIGVCSEAPVASKPNPLECLSNTDCKGSTSSFNFTGTCTCGINPYAASYCQPFIGDLQGLGYVTALKAFVKKAYAMQCNTMRRFSQQCWNLFKNTKEYSALVKAQYLYQDYPKLQNNDDCIQTLVFNDYYEMPTFAAALCLASLWLRS